MISQITETDLPAVVDTVVSFTTALHRLVLQGFPYLASAHELSMATLVPVHNATMAPIYPLVHGLYCRLAKHHDVEWHATLATLGKIGTATPAPNTRTPTPTPTLRHLGRTRGARGAAQIVF